MARLQSSHTPRIREVFLAVAYIMIIDIEHGVITIVMLPRLDKLPAFSGRNFGQRQPICCLCEGSTEPFLIKVPLTDWRDPM